MTTTTCLILWMPTGGFAGFRCVPAGAVSANNPATSPPDTATMNSDLRMTIAF